MTNFKNFLAEQLKDPDIREEYDTLAPAFSMIQNRINARQSADPDQKQPTAQQDCN